jgi:AcrR family transcriptional regulator
VTASPSLARGEQTKQLIVDTAVRLFREQGYEKTTMRSIAQAAGVSVGNAYYYFPSKDHLVQEFYRRIQDQHSAGCADALAEPSELDRRLLVALHAGLDAMAPYHEFAGSFFATAAAPGSPTSPFSEESVDARERSMAIFRSVVDGATSKLDAELRGDLPELLWLCHMGLTLYWVHDTSPGQAKSRMLVNRAVPLVDRLVTLSRLRVLRPLVREALALYRALR